MEKFPLSMGNTFWKELHVKAHETRLENKKLRTTGNIITYSLSLTNLLSRREHLVASS